MYVISHTCSVRSIIVISEYSKLFKLAYCHLCDVRHEVVWNTVWILTHCTTLMSSDWIEVTKKNNVPLIICLIDVHKYLLKHRLCPAVWVCTLSLWTLLCDRNLCRISVYCSWWRENDALTAILSHHINKCKCSCNIIVIVLPRLCHRLSYCFESCKVNTAIYLFFLKNLI